MRKIFTVLVLIGFAGAVAACDTDAERGLAGAVGGAAISKATGGDALTGAVLGAGAGVFCDDAGLC